MVIGIADSSTATELREATTGLRAPSRSSSRLDYLDALKVALIVLVVAHHAGRHTARPRAQAGRGLSLTRTKRPS